MDIVPQLIANSLIAGSIYAILTLGFNLTYATAKFIDMGFGVLTAVGGYAVFYLSKTLGAPLWLGALSGIILSGAISFLTYSFISSRSGRARHPAQCFSLPRLAY